MIDWIAFLYSGVMLLIVAVVFWVVSVRRNDVSIVDSLWSLMFLLVAAAYAGISSDVGPRTMIVLIMVSVWALRLSLYISVRNHGEPEDHRYQEIRANNEPGFRYKSVYIVFGFQALLAWIISMPLVGAIASQTQLGLLDMLGVIVWAVGVLFEAVGDLQLSRFLKNPANKGKVLDTGLWRYTRHPNYFGNFTLWWGFYLVALSAGAWWTIFSPLLMSFLLLKVSGVALLEKNISSRRPEYQRYIRNTNAFFPGFRVTMTSGLALLVAACSHQQPLQTVDGVDIERFMGDWYVIANIPTMIEKGAHNAVENYRLDDDGTIATTFTFRAGGYNGEPKSYHPRGFVSDENSAVWGMQFVWPIKADYRVIYLNDDYTVTVVGRNKRDYVWVMARRPYMPQREYAALLDMLESVGYDPAKIQKVPQRW